MGGLKEILVPRMHVFQHSCVSNWAEDIHGWGARLETRTGEVMCEGRSQTKTRSNRCYALLFSLPTKSISALPMPLLGGFKRDPMTTYGSPPAALGVQNCGAIEEWAEEEESSRSSLGKYMSEEEENQNYSKHILCSFPLHSGQSNPIQSL